MILPFVGFINKPDDQGIFDFTQQNFDSCLQTILQNIIGFFVAPLNYLVALMTELYLSIINALDQIRIMFLQIRDAIDKWDKSSKRLLMLPSFDLDQKSSLPYFLDIPHSLLFLVFYLQDLKIPCACLQLFDTRISGARIINGSGYIGAPRLFPIRWDNLNMNNITETTNLIVRPERDDCQNLFIASHVIEQECVQLTFPDIVSETLS